MMNKKLLRRLRKASPLLSVLLLVARTAVAPPLGFSDSGQTLGNLDTASVAFADVDSDGDLDVISGDDHGRINRIYTNDGSGVFTDTWQTGIANGTLTVLAADFDNDGDLDFLDGTRNAEITKIWLNNGAGTFADSGQSLGTGAVWGAATADYDGDGDMDVIVSNYGAANRLWLNNGAAAFTDSGQTIGPTNAYWVCARDLDGDGDMDLAFANASGNSEVWLNNGAGVFSGVHQSFDAGTGLWSVSPVDVDADGDADLIFGSNPALSPNQVWINDGNANFSDSGQSLGTGTTGPFVTADMDGDGDYDLIEGTVNGEDAFVYWNDGTGVFSQYTIPSSAFCNESIAVGDGDGDGDLDLVFGNNCNNNQINKYFINTFNYTNTPPDAPGPTAEPDAAITTATTNVQLQWSAGSDAETTDADLLTYDVRIGTTSGGCEVFCGTFPQSAAAIAAGPGNVGHTLSVTKTLAPGAYYWSVRTVDATYKRSAWSTENNFTIRYILSDSGQALGAGNSLGVAAGNFDTDTDIDFVAANFGAGNKVYSNDGSGAFTDSGQSLGAQDTRLTVAVDIDGDGDLDLVDGNMSQPNKVWRNNGAGVFTDTGQALGAATTMGLAAADVDGDGDMDLIEGNFGANALWINDGTGTFSDSGQSLGTSDTHWILAADVDGDGDIDFIALNYSGQGSKVWLNDGAGTFAASGQNLGSTDSTSGFAADVDGDGDVDFIEGNYSGTANKVWLNNGNGAFADSGQALGASNTSAIYAFDVDGDGDLDIYEGNDAGAADKVYLNNGTGTFADSGLIFGTTSARGACAADVDDSGDLDVIVVNQGGQANLVYLNNMNHSNSAPGAPALTAEPDALVPGATTSIALQWTPGSDPETADADLLTYDVRIGTASGGCEVFCGTFSNVANALAVGPGNAGHALSLTKTLAPGTYFWSARTVDATYKRSVWSAEDSFTVGNDNDPPAAGAVTPSNTDFNNTHLDAAFDLGATFTDGAGSGVASCEFCLSTDGTCDTEWAAATWAAGSCSATNLACTHAQSLTLNLRATDGFGNVGTGAAVTRTCDAAGPSAGAVTPSNTDYNTQYVDAAFDISATFTDGAGSGVASCEFCLSTDGACDTEWAAATWAAGACSITNQTCTHAQTITLNIRAFDGLGNVDAGAAVTRTCDTAGPAAAFNGPAASSSQNTAFPIDTSDTDAHSGPASCEYKVESHTGVAWVETKAWSARMCHSATSATISVQAGGDCRNNGADACRVTLRATDNAGNTGAEAARTFTITGVAASTTCGDVDGDGGVFSNDLLLASRAADGSVTLTSGQKTRADVVLRGSGAADGTLNTTDRDLIARVLVADGGLTSAGLACPANP